jgi:uncharacterized phage protein (TIGR01671 family)
MDRIRKYRGLILNSQNWIVGDLLKNNGQPIIVAQVDRNYITRTNVGEGSHWSIETPAYFIEPGTEGQFTGLLDKHGNEIYEGGICFYDTGYNYKQEEGIENDTYTGVIHFNESCYKLKCKEADFKFSGTYWFGSIDTQKIEIIGNIHQHSNLLP